MVNLSLVAGFNYYPCSRIRAEQGIEVLSSLPSDQCYRFDPPRRMRGVWLVELEGSEFLPNASSAPAIQNLVDEDDIWLEADWSKIDSKLPPPIEGETGPSPAAYSIEFIGRRAAYPAVYGMSGVRHMIILDELLSARAITPPRGLGRQEANDILQRRADEQIRREAREASAQHSRGYRQWLPSGPAFLCPRRPHADAIEDLRDTEASASRENIP